MLVKRTKWIKDTKIARKVYENRILDTKGSEIQVEYEVEGQSFTAAARAIVAEQLIQMGLISDPEEYMEMINGNK